MEYMDIFILYKNKPLNFYPQIYGYPSNNENSMIRGDYFFSFQETSRFAFIHINLHG